MAGLKWCTRRGKRERKVTFFHLINFIIEGFIESKASLTVEEPRYSQLTANKSKLMKAKS